MLAWSSNSSGAFIITVVHKAEQYKSAQGQWMMQHQPSMKQIMAIMAERDAAIQERNLALSEKKAAIAERDMAYLQRDAAIAERNNALLERDNAIATLQYRENSLTNNNLSCPPGCQIARGVKHIHHPQQQQQQQHTHHHVPHMNDSNYNSRELHANDACPVSSQVASESTKVRRNKRTKEDNKTITAPNKKVSKAPRKVKREAEDLNKIMLGKSQEWKDGIGIVSGGDDLNKHLVVSKIIRQCYKWGNGGWQSACCTTTVSMYPLPAVPNKRHARVGGRKMSGSAFNKLLSRLTAEGHDLSAPVDLKNHWAKHGTNRYITIK
ncbi:Protein BASIC PENTACYSTEINE6, partial [Cucurbita argyrosperma subsp. sororia]